MERKQIKLWVDDVRDPAAYNKAGWVWAKTYADAIHHFENYDVVEASLDHDLGLIEPSGHDLVSWMEEHDVVPVGGVVVHSANPAGAQRMVAGLRSLYKRNGFDNAHYLVFAQAARI